MPATSSAWKSPLPPVHKRLLAFFALACALTWGGNLGNAVWPSPYWVAPMNPLGPLLAAPIVIGWTGGRDGLRVWWRRITRFRAPARVYAASFFIPLAIIAASLAGTVAAGARLEPLPRYGLTEIVMTCLAVVLLAGPMTEELSFRGYGLDELQRRISPLAASLWVGLGVAIWHTPLFIAGQLPLTVLLPLAGVAVVYGWLYRAGGSVWPLVILHGQLNCVSSLVTGPLMPDAADQSLYLAFLGGFYLAWAAIILWTTGPSLVRARPDPGLPMNV